MKRQRARKGRQSARKGHQANGQKAMHRRQHRERQLARQELNRKKRNPAVELEFLWAVEAQKGLTTKVVEAARRAWLKLTRPRPFAAALYYIASRIHLVAERITTETINAMVRAWAAFGGMSDAAHA